MSKDKKKGNRVYNRRFIICGIKNFFRAVRLDCRCKKYAKASCKMTHIEKVMYCYSELNYFNNSMKVENHVYGRDLVPEDIPGCLFVGNHQGKDDCITALQALKTIPATFLIDAEASKHLLIRSICKAMDAALIDMKDLKQQVMLYREMGDKIRNDDYRYVIFPEAGYEDNKNDIRRFNAPCLEPAIRSHCPVVPFVLYDTWKIISDDTSGSIHVEVHFLKPIYYEEYKDMNRKQLAAHLNKLILEKMNEIKVSKGLEPQDPSFLN